jgi:hypothetical protein
MGNFPRRIRRFRRSRTWLVISIVLVILIASFAGLIVYWSRPGTTKDDVDSLLRQNLSTGATDQQIYQFLDEHRIEHTSVDTAEWVSELADYLPDTPVITATLRDVDNWPIGESDIYVYFILTKDGRLDKWRIKKILIFL